MQTNLMGECAQLFTYMYQMLIRDLVLQTFKLAVFVFALVPSLSHSIRTHFKRDKDDQNLESKVCFILQIFEE